MENERVNRTDNNYKSKRSEEVGYQGQQRRNANNGKGKPQFKKNSQSNGGYNAFAKDKDDDYEYGKKNESKKRISQPQKDKARDIQPDKADIAKRFEKEKKVMQKKKQDNKKNHQSQKPQMKAKRSNNIDWTRQYENDSYDDDDMSYYY